jgi:hypothetical protein
LLGMTIPGTCLTRAEAPAVGVDAVESVEELGGAFDLDAVERMGSHLYLARGGAAVVESRFPTAASRRFGMTGASGGVAGKGGVAGVEDEVVAFAVAIGFGDAEAQSGGFESED